MRVNEHIITIFKCCNDEKCMAIEENLLYYSDQNRGYVYADINKIELKELIKYDEHFKVIRLMEDSDEGVISQAE